MNESFRTGAFAGALLVVLGTVAWLTGRSFLFPSLGPSAYLLAVRPDAPESEPRRVVGGHAVGVVAGLVAYHALAPGLAVTTTVPPLSTAELSLVASATLSVVVTTIVMVVADLGHAPACATTLIVALGLLSTPIEGAVIVLAVVVLVTAQSLWRTVESTLYGSVVRSPQDR